MPNPNGPARIHIDANAILRFMRNDNPLQAEAVEKRLMQARAGGLVIDVHPLVLAEVVYVLKSVYAESRETIASALLTFLNTPGWQSWKKIDYEKLSFDFELQTSVS